MFKMYAAWLRKTARPCKSVTPCKTATEEAMQNSNGRINKSRTTLAVN
ncbi:MAG TPA: hypothetical protein GXX36_09070 [Clostridiaceae bacterium]|nr:hypothetical protein [Clostridiaceae bacterium]